MCLGAEVFRLVVTFGTIAWNATALEEVLVADSNVIAVSIGDQKETDTTGGTESPVAQVSLLIWNWDLRKKLYVHSSDLIVW